MSDTKEKRKGPGLFGRIAIRAGATLVVLAVLAAGLRFALPGLMRPREVITVVTVERRLEAIGELATYAVDYSGYTEYDSARRVFGRNVPGTRSSVKIAYSGTIKVGYEVSEIGVDVDAQAGVIRVTMPPVKVISNAIDEDSLTYEQVNNIFNPIRGDTVARQLDKVRAEELEKAEEMGLYDKALENARAIIQKSLDVFEGYRVEFVGSED